MVKTRFNYFKDNEDYIIQTINMYADKLKWAQEKNNEKWNTLGQYVWPNPVYYETYEEEIQHLKSWYLNRMEWLDSAFKNL